MSRLKPGSEDGPKLGAVGGRWGVAGGCPGQGEGKLQMLNKL